MASLHIAEFSGLAAFDQSSDQIAYSPDALLATLGAITAGTLYTNGTYPNVPLTGGTGSGATANITVSGGGVTAVQLVNRGTGYTAADSLSAAAANIGGTGSGFAVAVSTISLVSVPFQPNTRYVKVTAGGACSIAFGAIGTVVAAVGGWFLSAGESIVARVTPNGYKGTTGAAPGVNGVAAITDTP
jgi:hypothetical protein